MAEFPQFHEIRKFPKNCISVVSEYTRQERRERQGHKTGRQQSIHSNRQTSQGRQEEEGRMEEETSQRRSHEIRKFPKNCISVISEYTLQEGQERQGHKTGRQQSIHPNRQTSQGRLEEGGRMEEGTSQR